MCLQITHLSIQVQLHEWVFKGGNDKVHSDEVAILGECNRIMAFTLLKR
jgi:hypothetical protein